MKKPIIYLTIIFVVAVCSFVSGYFVYNLKDNSTNNQNYLNTKKLESSNETAEEISSNENQLENETNFENSNSTPSKSNQSSKKTSSSSKKTSKEEDKKVYLDIYYSETCSYCKNLLQFINSLDNKLKIVIRKHEITTDYSTFENAVNKYGNNPGYGVPYVVFNNEKALTGYSEDLENEYISYINGYLK